MNIKDLEPRQGDVDIIVEVVSIENPREFQKFGKPGRVANAVIKDATGEMKLTLWNEQIDAVHVGDKVHIQKGFVNEWQGEKQLTTGKFGTLEVVEAAGTQAEPKADQPSEPVREEIDEESIE
jgi:replication factor A1